MIKIAVCDDTMGVADSVKEMLECHEFSEEVQVDAFTDGKNLLKEAMKNSYHILLMDIELTGNGFSNNIHENGMLLADRVKDKYPGTVVIFLSRFPGYRMDLIRHEPFGFVEKPFFDDGVEMFTIVEDAIQRIRHREQNEAEYYIKISYGLVIPVKVKDILYFESQRPRVRVEIIGEDGLIFRKRLDDVEAEIMDITQDFIRTSKSFLINSRNIKGYNSKSVVMIDGTEIPISRSYIDEFKYRILK